MQSDDDEMECEPGAVLLPPLGVRAAVGASLPDVAVDSDAGSDVNFLVNLDLELAALHEAIPLDDVSAQGLIEDIGLDMVSGVPPLGRVLGRVREVALCAPPK